MKGIEQWQTIWTQLAQSAARFPRGGGGPKRKE
jgi:hypothetical protein